MRSLAMNLLCLAVVMLVFLSTVTSLATEDDRTEDDNRTTRDDDGDDETTALKYLMKYGWVPPPKLDRPAELLSKDQFVEHIKAYQLFAGLPVTGKLDKATKDKMKMPRCGNKDVTEEDDSKRRRRYVAVDQWGRTHISYKIVNYTPDMKKSDVQNEIERAFKLWSSASPLTFKRLTSGRADIEVLFAHGDHGDNDPFDGPGNTLAHAYFPSGGGDVHIDEAERWSLKSAYGTNLLQVIAHEIGHSLGLGHSGNSAALMAPFYKRYNPNLRLHSDDVRGIQSLYGRPVTKTTTTLRPAVPRRPFAPKTTTTTTTTTRRPSQGAFDICAESRFNAISTFDDGQQYAFMGRHYVRLLRSGVDPAYPQTIASRWPGLPTPVDAVLHRPSSYVYQRVGWSWRVVVLPAHVLFFKGSRVWKYSRDVLQTGYPKLIRTAFPGLPNSIDSAYQWTGNTRVYFTKGSSYYRLSSTSDRIDRGYPRSLRQWKGLPSSVDAVFKDDNNHATYFFKNKQYYRFDDENVRVYSYYPRPIARWWLACNPGSLIDGRKEEVEADEGDRSDGGVTSATSDEMMSQANDDGDGLNPENGAARQTLRITSALLVAAFVSLLSS